MAKKHSDFQPPADNGCEDLIWINTANPKNYQTVTPAFAGMTNDTVSVERSMARKPHRHIHPANNANGGAAGILIALVLVLALAGGGGYWTYTKYFKKEPLRTKLASMKIKEELVAFTHDHVSTALYGNMVLADDIVVMMDKELDRLKRIGKKFPNQREIVAAQTKELTIARDGMAKVLADVSATLEKMYVTWLVDRSEGAGQIRSQKGTLTRQLADVIRGEAVLISRIRTNPDATS